MGFDVSEIQKFYENRFSMRDVITLGKKKYVVSTVELPPGSFWGMGYETMIFVGDEDGKIEIDEERYCERYENEEDARRGHARALEISEDDLLPSYGEE